MKRLVVLASFGAAALLISPVLRAEPDARDRAAAEATFRQATALMDEQRYAEACEKFAASQQLDPGLGTLLHLADCYDRAGRTASAWALFREVEDRSRRATQPDRERIARERAEALEGKLSKLELNVPPERRIPGLKVKVGGSVIPSASWNTALPVDPGVTQLELSAPGKRTARLQITVAPGPSQQAIDVPELADAPRPPQAPRATSGPAPVSQPAGSTQKTIGFVMSAAGLVALGVGGYFGYRAHEQNNASKAQCRAEDPNACTRIGFDRREAAKSSANLATIAGVSGAALTLGGLMVVLTAPGSKREIAAVELGWRGAW
jgi:serine/threonine-protein kinase